ncbi:MAG TPA: phage major capsid protein [Pirellulales bacterium]|jgi:HK97 family phage major capsid protein|nr:phage major capsid protein [Pirellulales bacterium]
MIRSDLQSQRRELANQIRALAAEQPAWTPAHRREWDRLNSEYDRVKQQLDPANAAPAGNDRRRLGRDGGTLDDGPTNREFFATGGERPTTPANSTLDCALRGWARNALGLRVTPSDADACDRYGIALNAAAFHARLPIHGPQNGFSRLRALNDLSTGIGSAGGFTTPEGFVPRLERALLSFSGVMQAAEIMTTDSGNPLPWPTADDTGNIGSRIGENTDASATGNDPKFGAVVFQAPVYTSNMVRVSNALLEDTGVDLAGALGAMLGERIGRKVNLDLTTCPGGNGPLGIVNAATLGPTAASSTEIEADDLVALLHAIDPAYLGEGCGWMMHNSIVHAIRLLKDGQGRYMWSDGLQMGQPPMLLGFPVFLNQAMDSTIASGNKTVLFGALNKYKVRRVRDVRLMKLVERYAEFDESGFIAYLRCDGALLDAGTHPVQYLQH